MPNDVTGFRWAPVARVFSAVNVDPQSLQQMVNAIRAVADIQRFFPVNHSNEIVAAGTPEQMALAQWLFDQLDKPGAGTPLPDYTVAGSTQQARVVYLPHAVSPEALKELLKVQKERGVEHAVVLGGEDKSVPMTRTLFHAYRALRRGGKKSIRDFEKAMGLPGRMMMAGSRIVGPVAEHPGKTLAALALGAVPFSARKNEMRGIEGRTAVLSGAAKLTGIGFAFAQGLARAGAQHPEVTG